MQNIETRLGQIEGFSKIWLEERVLMAKTLTDLSSQMNQIKTDMRALTNRIIGATCAISFLSVIITQIVIKFLL